MTETLTSTTPATEELFCPACGSSSKQNSRFEFESGRGETPWARCSSCQTYFMVGDYDASQEAEHTKNMAWGNAEKGAELNERKTPGFVSALDQIEALGYGGSKILDVGCSFGGILIEARKRGFDCAGVDIVPEAIDWMQQQGFRAEVCSSLDDCTLYSADNPADVISVLDAHIYWPDQKKELQAAHRLLRDDGLLAIRAVTKSAFITAGRMVGSVSQAMSKKLIRRAIADHRFSMPLPSLLTTVEESGFEIISASPRGAVHTSGVSLPVRTAFAMGTVLWHGLGVSVAPTTLVFARKRA